MFIDDLYSELNETFNVIGTKLNALNTAKEAVANKKTDLTSTNAAHYPNVPAVNAGLAATLSAAQSYVNNQMTQNNSNYVHINRIGAANGVAPLGSDTKIPAAYLPSFVDDVVDVTDFVTTNPTSGMVAGNIYFNTTTNMMFTATSATAGVTSVPEGGKIYVKITDNTTWRWSGTTMVQTNGGLALGETSSTAYRGDRGKIAYDHSQASGNPHNTTVAQISGLQTTLNNKVNLDLSNASSSLTDAQKTAFRDKIGAGSSNTVGTVTSVAVAAPTGFTVSGSPITNSGTITLAFATGYSLPTNTKQTQWDTAYSNTHTHSNQAILDATTASFTTTLKGKLDGLNNYTLPTASATVLGGVKVGANLSISADGVLSSSFTNTTYTAGNGLTLSGTVFSLPVTISGTGNYVQSVVQSTNGITVTLGTLPTAYVLPTASSTTLGGVKLGSDTVQTVAANTVSATASKTYAVQVNSSGQMVVNVPWANDNTTYTLATLTEMNTGTQTAARVHSPSVLNQWADAKYAKLADLGDPTTAVPDWSAALTTQLTF